MNSKIPIFVGDVHGNAAAMTQIINCYKSEFYTLYWLGDFINSKDLTTSDKEIEYVIHLMMEQCHNVLHSNHMHILFEYLTSKIYKVNDKKITCNWRGWEQTKKVVDNLHPSIKRNIIEYIKKSLFTVEVKYQNDTYIAAHSIPQLKTIGQVPQVRLTYDQVMAIGIKSSRNFWKNKYFKEKMKPYKYIICGHHGMVARFGNVRIIDLRGAEIPVFDPSIDRFRIF